MLKLSDNSSIGVFEAITKFPPFLLSHIYSLYALLKKILRFSGTIRMIIGSLIFLSQSITPYRMVSTALSGLGVYTPTRVLSNEDLVKILAASGQQTSVGWIESHTGIRIRHIAAPHETNQTMAVEAARMAINNQMSWQKSYPIDLIIFATNTNERLFPSSALFVHQQLFAQFGKDVISESASGYDPSAGCGGINLALCQADLTIKAGFSNSVLVIGSETLSRVADYSDRGTCILFGDGASAYLCTAIDSSSHGFRGHRLSSNGSLQNLLGAVVKDRVVLPDNLDGEVQHVTGPTLVMDGGKVHEFVLREIEKIISGFQSDYQLNPERISLDRISSIICHQANQRMFERIGRKYPVFLERFISTIAECGNTSTALQGPPLQIARNRARPGDFILMIGFGAGMTVGANLYRLPTAD